jgi:hypothetical protein
MKFQTHVFLCGLRDGGPVCSAGDSNHRGREQGPVGTGVSAAALSGLSMHAGGHTGAAGF